MMKYKVIRATYHIALQDEINRLTTIGYKFVTAYAIPVFGGEIHYAVLEKDDDT